MNNFPFALTDKIAVVTGGGTGLGFGIAKAFAEAGSKVVITGRRDHILKTTCKKLPNGAEYIVNDITELDTLPGLIDEIETRIGPVDILVNNAGINQKKNSLKVTDQEFENIIQTNLKGLFVLARETGKKMVERNRGSIINITSMAAIYGIPKVSAYSASKAGVLGLTRALAADFSPDGIRSMPLHRVLSSHQCMTKRLNQIPKESEGYSNEHPCKNLGLRKMLPTQRSILHRMHPGLSPVSTCPWMEEIRLGFRQGAGTGTPCSLPGSMCRILFIRCDISFIPERHSEKAKNIKL